jgi:AraC-like DNA-binding protein
MKKLLAFIILFLSISANAQDKKLDSLKLVLENHPQKDTVQFNILMALADLQLFSKPTESKRYIELAIDLGHVLKNKKCIADGAYLLTHYYYNRAEYTQAHEQALIALNNYENVNDARGLYDTYQLLAMLNQSWKDFKKMDEYLNKMQELATANKSFMDAYFYQNLGFLKTKAQKYQEGLALLNEAIALHQNDNLYELATCYFLRGKANMALGNTNAALSDFEQCISNSRLSKHPDYLINVAIGNEGIGSVYIAQKKFPEALPHLDSALAIGLQMNSKSLALGVYKSKIMLYEAQGNFKEALQIERLHRQLSDSIFNKEKSQQIAEAQTKYETDKKEHTIELLQKDKKINNLWRSILIVGIIVLAIFSVTLYLWQKSRYKKNSQLLNLQVDLLTSKNQELANKYKLSAISFSEHEVESSDEKLLKKAITLVERNLSDSLFGVEKMASEIGMSRASLHKKLKSITGFAPSEFIRNIRLKRAANLLRNRADSVTQIGFSVGFEDQSYFSKSFKKQFGVTPSEYESKADSLV